MALTGKKCTTESGPTIRKTCGTNADSKMVPHIGIFKTDIFLSSFVYSKSCFFLNALNKISRAKLVALSEIKQNK